MLGPLDGMLKQESRYRRVQFRQFLCLYYLVLPLALRALQPQHQLLGGLGLLSQDRLGLTSEPLLFAVVPVGIES